MPNMPELNEKSRLDKKVVVRRMRRCRNNLSRGVRCGNRKWCPRSSYGRLFYNYFRTYDPATGRYLESDPIGLDGGLNTFGYAYQNPLSWTDSRGLDPVSAAAVAEGIALCTGPQAAACAGAAAVAGVGGLSIYTGNKIYNTFPLQIGDFIDSTVEFCTLDDSQNDILKPYLNEDKKLTPGEIKKLKGKGIDPEALKGGKGTGKLDLFKDRKGNIKVKPKDGSGPGEPTGININDL